MHVPHLRQKLNKLYRSGRNPDITSDEALGVKLKIGAGQIQNYCNGNGGQKPNHIPEKHAEPLCQLFNLMNRAEWELTDMRRFDERIARPVSAWGRLWQRAESRHASASLTIEVNRHRGIGVVQDAEDQAFEGQSLELDQYFRIRVEGRPAWHVTLLAQDPVGVACLCPNPSYGFPEYRLNTYGTMTLPPDDRQPFFATRPTGQHWLVAVHAEKPLPKALYDGLTDALPGNREKALEDLVRWLEGPWPDGAARPGESFVLREPFFIADP